MLGPSLNVARDQAKALSGRGALSPAEVRSRYRELNRSLVMIQQQVELVGSIAESTVPVTLDAKGCRVVSGRWHDPYTGRVFTDPRRLDIDHFIPLAEVHRSGGHAWTPAQRRQYANDLSHPDTLIAVSASANRSKGDRDPVHWLPPNRAYCCGYLKAWVDLKRHWGLAADPVENQFVAESP